MQVLNVRLKKAQEEIQVIDLFVGKGLRVGGHAALPDVDIDFQSDRRLEMKDYLEERYNLNGKQRVFSAGTFTTLKLKAVLKDVGRVHGVPHSIVNYITAMIDDDATDWSGLFKLAFKNKKVAKFINDYPQMIEDIRTIMGQPKATSIHASAVIVVPDHKDGEDMECFDFVPIRKMDGLLVSEFDGYSVDEIGLLKNDMLATKELTKLSRTIDIVNRVYGKSYTIEHIATHELNDDKTYNLFTKGFTQNIFQFSSAGMTKFMMDMQPTGINDLIAGNALYRPATIEVGATDDYVRYKKGESVPVYDYGTYEATKETYGLYCYQEEFMNIAQQVAGFDASKVDLLRKAIGKKKRDLMATLKDDFIKGAMDNGCPEEDAKNIWHKIEVAGGYSFNKSHAAAYALTAYVGAWLKANYPTAFYTTALEFADDDEIPSLMSEMEQVSSAKIVSPDINVSRGSFFTDYETNKIYWSLTRIKFLGDKAVEYILNERGNGQFLSIEDFIYRVFKKKRAAKPKRKKGDPEPDNDETEDDRCPVNSRHIKQLIVTGCFDAIERVGNVTERYAILKKANEILKFGIAGEDFPETSIVHEYFWATMQIAASGIGSIDYKRVFDNSEAKKLVKGRVSYMALKDVLNRDNENNRVAVCATVADVTDMQYKDKETGEGKVFGKVILQQNNSTVELVVWPDHYMNHRGTLVSSKGKMIVVSASIRYSAFSGQNTLQMFNNSIVEKVE